MKQQTTISRATLTHKSPICLSYVTYLSPQIRHDPPSSLLARQPCSLYAKHLSYKKGLRPRWAEAV